MKIIYQETTKSGKEILIRYPEISDLDEMLRYINELSDEKTFIRYQGEHETFESEKKYLEGRLEAIKNKKAVHLLAFCNNQLIAATDVHMKDKTEQHVGILGISVARDFRGEGLGKLLMQLVLKEVEKEIRELKIVTLEVYSTNNVAQKIYQKFGFVKYGLLPNGITRDGNLEDAILMYKNIR